MSVLIITDYTARSHVLCGEAIKDVYVDFRIQVLRVVEWATWHHKLSVPGGKGWCIRKDNLPDLFAHLHQYNIPHKVQKRTQSPKTSKPRSKKEKKGPRTAYAFFAKEKWVEARCLLPESEHRNNAKISKMVSMMWKKVNTGPTKWHALEEESRREFEKVMSQSFDDSVETKVANLPNADKVTRDKTYEEKWNDWVAGKSGRQWDNQIIPGRHYETEFFTDLSVDPTTEHHRFLVWSEDGDEYKTLTITTPASSDRDLVYKKAWDMYFSDDNNHVEKITGIESKTDEKQ